MPKKKLKISAGKYFSNICLSEYKPGEPIELISTAKQTDPFYGDFSYTKEELMEMAENFNNNVAGIEIAVDINHDPQKKAYAWIEPNSMFVAESQNIKGKTSLYGKLYKLTPEGEELITTGAYRYFSLEIREKVEKYVDNVKKSFNNVIRGLALTNSPVIKDLAPTYSEQNILFSNSKQMELFKILLAEMAKQPTVSLSEKANLKTMFKALSEEEQKEVETEVEKVEEKPEQTDEEIKAEEDAKKELSEAKAELEKTKKLSESKLSDTDKKFTELQEANIEMKKELSEIKQKEKEATITNLFSEVILSEKVKVGFAAESKELDAAKSFASTLSEEQAKEFFTVVKGVKSVDLSEIGEGEGGDADDKEGDDKSEKRKELAEKMAKDKDITFSEALRQVIRDEN